MERFRSLDLDEDDDEDDGDLKPVEKAERTGEARVRALDLS